jgi:alanine racemase
MRTSHIRIDKNKIINNLAKLRKAAGKSDIIGIIKANAYGHGIKAVANILRLHDVEYLGVAYPVEAAELREAGDHGKIIIIVPPSLDDAKHLIDNDLEFVIDSFDRLKKFDSFAKDKNYKLKAHLFINTGMNRDGIYPEETLDFFTKASDLENIHIKGICTQLAESEMHSSDLVRMQINKFKNTLRQLKKAGFDPEMKHINNTGGVINYPEAGLTHSRTGIGLYGYADEKNLADKIDLEPAMTVLSEILTIRTIKKGENIGYSKQYISDCDMKIGVVPIGYGDGYSKLFTNKGKVIHNGSFLPVIGSVCMDQFMIDLTGSDDAKVGDELVLLGSQGKTTLTAYNLADQIGTIPYEILTTLNNRLTRKYY